jgi:hypothetical protein
MSDFYLISEVIQMDPDKTLDELVELGFQLAETSDRERAEELLEEIVEKATALREWLNKGGFSPDANS